MKEFHGKKVLALILAGGVGGRLGLLTENRAKPVMPFAGRYKLIDFALSNCAHSGISDVWVIEQYELHSLNEHLSNGRPWDLDRTYGGLKVLPPFQQRDKSNHNGGFAHGNADAIARHLDFIKNFAPDILLVLSADHIYKLDFREVFQKHLETEACLTMVTAKVPKGEKASRFGVVKVNKNGRITDFAYKPEKPESDLITTEVFVYDAKRLLETLDKLTAGNDSIKDFGDELVPKMVKDGEVFEFRHTGYWLDVGTMESYWRAHIDLLDEKQKFVLEDPDWAILTHSKPSVPAFIYSSAEITNSLVAHGSKISGTVKKSVLSEGVTVEKGAELEECVVLPDAVIEKGVKLKRTIVDANVRVTAKKSKSFSEKQKRDILVIGQRKAQTSSEIKAEAEEP